MRRIDLRRLDVAVAAALTLGLGLEAWLSNAAEGHPLANGLLWLPVTLGVAVRRRYPLVVGAGAMALAILGQSLWPSQLVSGGVAWMCCMYALAVWTRTRAFTVVMAAYLSSLFWMIPLGENTSSAGPFYVISAIAIVLVRVVVGNHDRRARVAERERDLAAREAVVEERARIARELHDAIAHNVSMMVVQAGAERRVLDDDQSSTREVLQTVEEIGRGALTEMRRLVGMLRSDESDPLAPQPGLDDLATLVAQVREAGLPVDLEVEGDRRELPVGLELSAYRIVQEALTNALKHAGDAEATVRVRYGPDSLELEIVDDGAGAPARAAGGGHGLVGMRERVALYGGRFEAGRRPAGGFTVRVLLPIR
ncbi:MAG TPA: sensor histidine kinase [Gaiellaceae bacterium]|nr:sensor histidine kinase [Gaiellaceae bacterium]